MRSKKNNEKIFYLDIHKQIECFMEHKLIENIVTKISKNIALTNI